MYNFNKRQQTSDAILKNEQQHIFLRCYDLKQPFSIEAIGSPGCPGTFEGSHIWKTIFHNPPCKIHYATYTILFLHICLSCCVYACGKKKVEHGWSRIAMRAFLAKSRVKYIKSIQKKIPPCLPISEVHRIITGSAITMIRFFQE